MIKTTIRSLFLFVILMLCSCTDTKTTNIQNDKAIKIIATAVPEQVADMHNITPSDLFDSNYAHIVYFWLKRPENQ